MAKRLLAFEDLRARGILQGKTQLWRLEKAGKFPRRVKIGSRNGWIETEVDAFIEEQIAARDANEAA